MKFLVVGCGSIGKRHIRNLISLNHEVIGFDISSEAREEAGKKISIPTFSDFDAALEEKLNAVFICNPNSEHIPSAIKVAQKGLHLFIEKPLSHDLNGVDKFIEIAKEKRLVTFIGFNMRFNASLIKIKKLLDEEKIGKIISSRVHFGSYLPYRHPSRDYRGDYGAKKSLGGGVILDAIHQIDYIQWFLGEVEEVFCYSGKMSNFEIDVEDNAEILLKFKSGAVASLHLDYIQRPYQNKCELIGENGTIQWEISLQYDVQNNIYSSRSEKIKHYNIKTGKWQIIKGDDTPDDAYIREIEYFINCIKRKEKPIVDGEYGKRVLEVALAAKKSSEIHNIVRVWK